MLPDAVGVLPNALLNFTQVVVDFFEHACNVLLNILLSEFTADPQIILA